MAKSKAVAKASVDTEVMERPAWMDADSGRGSEEVSIDDLTLPRLQIIQDLSPQHKENKTEYIEGAKVGMMLNTITQELYDTALTIIPVFYRTEHIVWKHRDAGGGFMGSFPTEEEAARSAAEDPQWGQTTSKGDPIIEVTRTGVHFCLIVKPDGGLEEIVISMSKSQLKPSRNFDSMIKIAGGDRFSRYYRIEVAEVDGPKGDYQNYKITPLGYVTEQHYKAAESLYESISRGERDVDRSDELGSKSADVGDEL